MRHLTAALEERYYVQTTHGSLEPLAGGWARSADCLSAHVLDSHVAHRVVKTFRSEDYHTTYRITNARRAEMAVADAQVLADQLNAEETAAVAAGGEK